MSCKNPLKAFPVDVTAKGKTKYKVVSNKVDHLEFIGDKWIPVKNSYRSPGRLVKLNYIEIPCGKCIGCRLDYSKRWADRCLLEMMQHEDNYFVTLTYDDDHLPCNTYVCPESGEVDEECEVMTLVKSDLQKFMKRLRKNTGQELRYYACGEYGDSSCRPHYHLILFGLKLDDLQVHRLSKNGFPTYTSKTIEKAWPFGFSLVMESTWETCAYTARYVMKKLNGSLGKFYEENNIEPEFVLMSRRPGIGRAYLDKHQDLFNYQTINVPTLDGGHQMSIPKYFERIKEEIDPEFIAGIKDRRKTFARFRQELKENRTSFNHLDYLLVEEENLKARTKSLKRKEI